METWSSALDFKDLAEKFSTPLYLFNPRQMEQNFNQFKRLVKDARNIYYPVKANPSPVILRELQRMGAGVDCATPQEVELVLYEGFRYEQIIYNSPAPHYPLVKTLLTHGGKVVADSTEILKQIEALMEGLALTGQMLVRINPETAMEYQQSRPWQQMTQHASDRSKFGIPSEDLVEIVKYCQLPISGLHIHVGTQMDNMEVYQGALDLLHRLCREIESSSEHRISMMDLGGGLGINFFNEQSYPSIDNMVDALKGQLNERFAYLIEPGQALVGNTMGLLTEVQEVKKLRDKKWAIIDTGSNELMKVTLLNWHHRFLNQNHEPLPSSGDDSIGGPLCFAGDVLLPNTDLREVEKGDVLFMQHTGAYCSSASNNFNGFSRPSMLIVDEHGECRMVEKKEDHFAVPTLLGFAPQNYEDELEYPQNILMEHILNLSSDYLREGANNDRFEILKTTQVTENTLDFTLDVTSSLGVLSMPMAVRIMAETGIVSALHFLDKSVKDISVWGTRLYMISDKMIKINKPIKCRVSISPSIKESSVGYHTNLAYIEIENGHFSSVFKFVL